MAVHEDRVGRVWYGEKDGLWWRRPGGDFERIPTPWPSEVYVRSIFETSLGHVWLAGTQGAIRFDGERFRTFATEDGLPRSNGIAFGEDARQRLWAAVDTGLYRLESELFVEVRTPEATPFPEVLSFLAEPDGTLWLGTRGEGLWRRRESAVDKVGTAQGLPVSSVHAILDDGLGFLWMPSPHGIVRAARADLHAVADGRSSRLGSILLDRRDGLPSVECSFSQPSCARDPSGRLWFATQRGIAVVQPSTFRPNPIAPPVRILRVAYHTASRIDGDTASPAHGDQDARSSRVVIQNPTADRPLSIPPGSFGLEIAYAAPSFSAPEKVRFQTRLDGISRYWDDAGNQRLARFEQLPPGDYTFRVRAANQDGVGNEAGAALAFVVRPFFWQTPSFRGVLGLLLAATGAAAVWWRTRARRQSELAEMERLQREMIERKRTEETLARQRNELAHMSRVTMLGELSGSLA
ncbi:MAG: hypothetical protein L6Q38_19045, partial [Nitrospira sp.]|nr:hypothetical protein [Nitrospira sp.]